MGFDKKLLLAGLAVGVTALILYKRSKEKKNAVAAAHAAYPPQQQYSPAPYGSTSSAPVAVAAVSAAAAAPGEVSWNSLRDPWYIAKILADTVQDQFLWSFYSFSAIWQIAQELASSGTLLAIADDWQLPPQLAQDLVKLSLFNVAFLLDDSASMTLERGERQRELRDVLQRAASAAGRLDRDGMEVRWLNSRKKGNGIRTADEARRFAEKCDYDGRSTPLGTSLEDKILESLVYNRLPNGLKKPALIIIITDGQPTGERQNKIVSVVKEAKVKLAMSRYGEDAVSFQIAQVGNDADAQNFLDSLDADPEVGDLVDVTSNFRTESEQISRRTGGQIQLSPELHNLKILLGGIDSSFDDSDERNPAKYQRRAAAASQKRAKWAREIDTFESEKAAVLGAANGAPTTGPMQQFASTPPPPQYGYYGSSGAAQYGTSAPGTFSPPTSNPPYNYTPPTPSYPGAPSAQPFQCQAQQSYAYPSHSSPYPSDYPSGPPPNYQRGYDAAPGQQPSPQPGFAPMSGFPGAAESQPYPAQQQQPGFPGGGAPAFPVAQPGFTVPAYGSQPQQPGAIHPRFPDPNAPPPPNMGWRF